MSKPETTALIYGANGYTGDLVAREAVARGMRPILAGRSRDAVEPLANTLGCEWRAFALTDPAALVRGLEGVRAVLHCAGPFVHTSRPMVEACLAAGAHYLDITGEIAVFERVLGRDEAARSRGIALIPGVGFDVVPSDALARRLSEALPGATHLDLAFVNHGGGWSRGTALTMVEALPRTGAVRRDGVIVPVPLAHATRTLDLPIGRRLVMTIAWGDIATAFRTTGIPNLRTFAGVPPATVRRLRWLRPFVPVLGWSPVKSWLRQRVHRTITGPTAHQRETGRVYLWGKAWRDDGTWVTGTLEVREGYRFTAEASVECLRRTLEGAVPPGAWTPARAFGLGLIDALPGTAWGPLVNGTAADNVN